MQRWRWPFLGIEDIPSWLTEFETEYFFRLSAAELAITKTRHGSEHRLAIALQIGFLRMSGRVLNSPSLVPKRIIQLLGEQLEVAIPDIASLRALYGRKPTLHEHQNVAKQALGFRALGEHGQGMLISHLRVTRGASIDPMELVMRARQWLYEHHYLIPAERTLLDLARAVLEDSEAKLLLEIERSVPHATRKRWFEALAARRPEAPELSGVQWLKASVRARRGQGLIDAFHKVQYLLSLHVDGVVVPEIPLALAKAYAARLARTKLATFARLRRTTRTLSVIYFMKLALWRAADDAIEAWLMRVGELRGEVYTDAANSGQMLWQARFDTLIETLRELTFNGTVANDNWRRRVAEICERARCMAQGTRRERVRHAWFEHHGNVRRLLRLLFMLPLRCVASNDRPLGEAIEVLKALYRQHRTQLPDGELSAGLLYVAGAEIANADRGIALRILEFGVLQRLHRGLRNGSISVSASLAYRERESLFVPPALWLRRRGTLTAALSVNDRFTGWSQSLKEAIARGLVDVARAARKGQLTIGPKGVHLPRDPALPFDSLEQEDTVRRRVAELLGNVEFPRLMLEVDSVVRFSALLLKRAPHSSSELQALYAALLAHGCSLDRSEVIHMIPAVTDRSLVLMMRLLLKPSSNGRAGRIRSSLNR